MLIYVELKILSSKENGPSGPGIIFSSHIFFEFSVNNERFFRNHILVNRLQVVEKCVYFVTVSDGTNCRRFNR